MPDTRVLIVATEAILALAITASAWLLRRQRPAVFWFFPLVGASWAGLAHGVYFFSATPESEWGSLAGFGIASALFFGLPAGFLAFGVAQVWWRRNRKMRPDK
jgi:hypothetical protein